MGKEKLDWKGRPRRKYRACRWRLDEKQLVELELGSENDDKKDAVMEKKRFGRCGAQQVPLRRPTPLYTSTSTYIYMFSWLSLILPRKIQFNHAFFLPSST